MSQTAGVELGDRVEQPCHGCGAVDDHPRHHIINSFADDSLNTTKHLDCCNCEYHCAPALAAANGKKGLELAAFLVQQAEARGAVDHNEGLPEVGATTPPVTFTSTEA